jgi:C-terminal processing protease CtpA/Prc
MDLQKIKSLLQNHNKHSTIILKNKKVKNKFPIFEFKNNIGYIKFFKFSCLDCNYLEQTQQIKLIIQKHISEWINNKNILGIIIDLRYHTGGSFVPVILGLSELLGNGSLFGINKNKTYFDENNWVSLENNKIIKSKFVKPNNFKIKVAVLIGDNTCSAGEFIALALKRENSKFFGDNSRGLLSINKNYQFNDFIIALTQQFVTDIYGNFYNNENIKYDHYSTRPKLRAKQWLINK